MNEYSLSLFTLGKEENMLDDFYGEVRCLLKVFKDEDINEFLESKFYSKRSKKEIISNCINGINKYLSNFINIVIDEGKEENLVKIFNAFNELYYKDKNILKGIVYGIRLEEEKLVVLEETFSKKLNKKVVLEFREDSSLIGGYKVIIDNKLYDNSYKNKLTKLKDKLLKEGELDD